MKLRPHYLFLNYTEECNSRCSTCLTWAKKNPVTLPVEVFRRIGRFVNPTRLREVYFTGGEPFLPANAVEMALAVNDFWPGVAITGATNSIRPVLYLRRIEAMVRAGLWLNIFVSLNGPPATHDATRGVTGNYERTMEMAAGLKGLGIWFNFNQLEIPGLTTERDREHVREMGAKFGVGVCQSPVLRRMEWFGQEDDGQTGPPIEHCQGGAGVICIRPNGDITACQETRPELVFANLRDDCLDAERAARIQRRVAAGGCQPCGCCTISISHGQRPLTGRTTWEELCST